jgi:hypothetical protein
MANLKWGSISAICALIISILLGAVSGVGAIHIFARALIFSAVFFGIGFGLRFVINTFFPELLFENEENIPLENNGIGEQAGISLDSMGEYAVPELFNKQGNSEELGNVEDLISGVFKPRGAEEGFSAGKNQSEYSNFDYSMSSDDDDEGIDRNREAGYNNLGVSQNVTFMESADEKPEVNKSAAFQQQFTPSFGDDSGLGGLPDLDVMAMAFSSNYTPTPAAPSASSAPSVHPVEEYEPDRSQYKGNKPQTLNGDFNPQSLAQGIRTILNKS